MQEVRFVDTPTPTPEEALFDAATCGDSAALAAQLRRWRRSGQLLDINAR